MYLRDIISFSLRASLGYPVRTFLMLLAMAIGVGSVVILSTLGEGARRYVIGQFSNLGTNLIIVLPGRVAGDCRGDDDDVQHQARDDGEVDRRGEHGLHRETPRALRARLEHRHELEP